MSRPRTSRVARSSRNELATVERSRADPQGQLLLGQAQLLLQALIRVRLLERLQLLALNVLDQRQLQQLIVLDGPHPDGDRGEARLLGRSPTPLSRDDLVARSVGAYQDRLEHSALFQRSRELRQLRRADVGARLLGVGLEAADRDFLRTGTCFSLRQ